MMNKSIPLSTLNLKSTKGKSGLLGGPGYLLGKSGGGKGKFDLEYIMEREDDFTQTIGAGKINKNSTSASFSKNTGSTGGDPTLSTG